MIRKKFVWLMILMVWVGMVTSIVIYQGDDYLTLEPVTTEPVEIMESEFAGESEPQVVSEGEPSLEEEIANGDYFMDHRVDRNKVRSERINSYREMINNPNHSEEARRAAENKLLELNERIEKEMEIEGLLKGRGHEEALAFIHDEAVDVIIQSENLTREEVAIIGDIIIKATEFSPGDLTIIEKRANQEQ